MDAGATGGTVDLKLAKARKKPSFNAMSEGGYNNLFSNVGDSKTSVGGSTRFLKNKFGIEVEIFEPKQVKGIPTFWNNPSIMSLFTLNELITDGSLENLSILKNNDSFSNKIWYKRFVDLL